MAKGEAGAGDAKPGKADKSKSGAAGAKADDQAAKAERKQARKIVKVEVQLADAREIRAAVDVLVETLERKLAELRPDGPAPAAASLNGKPSVAPRKPRATATAKSAGAAKPRRPVRPRTTSPRRPRRPGPSA